LFITYFGIADYSSVRYIKKTECPVIEEKKLWILNRGGHWCVHVHKRVKNSTVKLICLSEVALSALGWGAQTYAYIREKV
jgi:hypothetical protein